jgi:hypothetical protein
MRLNYILIIIILLLGFAIGLTLKEEKVDLDSWRKDKADLQLGYVDDTIERLPPVLEVNYFERQNDIHNLFVISRKSKVQRSEEQRTQGRYSGEIVFGTTWEEIALVYFPQMWSKYRYLKLDIYNPQDTILHLQFRIGDYFDNEKWYLDSQRFKKEVDLHKGWNRLEFSMDEIASKININSPRRSIHLSFFPRPGEKVYIDNMRLVK